MHQQLTYDMNSTPEILTDRMAVVYLQKEKPWIARLLSDRGIGKTGKRETVHFCGLADAATGGAVFFLPRHSKQNCRVDIKTAGLTMRALARFGREVESRKGIASSAGDNAVLAALIGELAEDFRDHGIYAERARYNARNSGKPDWKRTIAREMPLLTSTGVPVFPETRTTRTLDSHENPLAQIQAAVVGEIIEKHSWWLEGVTGRAEELRSFRQPASPRFLWPAKLRSLLPTLYANRPVSLAKSLIAYVEETAGHSEGEFICGVEDFSNVWEHMLRKVLPGVEDGWNARLPKPGYIRTDDGAVELLDRGMQTDIVVREDDHLTVVDAKYYAATGKGSVPGWPDIVKQLYYQMALEKVVDRETISNCFAFPAARNTLQPFSLAKVFLSRDVTADGFPEIGCVYIDIIDVMQAYCRGSKIRQTFPVSKVSVRTETVYP